MSKLRLYASNYLDENVAEFGMARSLMSRKDTIGKVSRSGFKRANRAKRFGKKIGRAGINRVKNSNRVRSGVSAVRSRLGNTSNGLINKVKNSGRLKSGFNKGMKKLNSLSTRINRS